METCLCEVSTVMVLSVFGMFSCFESVHLATVAAPGQKGILARFWSSDILSDILIFHVQKHFPCDKVSWQLCN